jgi:hypothetical protein
MTYQGIYNRVVQLHKEGKSVHYMVCQLANENQAHVNVAIDVLLDQINGEEEILSDDRQMMKYERQIKIN